MYSRGGGQEFTSLNSMLLQLTHSEGFLSSSCEVNSQAMVFSYYLNLRAVQLVQVAAGIGADQLMLILQAASDFLHLWQCNFINTTIAISCDGLLSHTSLGVHEFYECSYVSLIGACSIGFTLI